MRVATGGLAASDRITPVSISARIAPISGLSTVHHHSEKGVRSSRESMAAAFGQRSVHWSPRLVTGELRNRGCLEMISAVAAKHTVMPRLDRGIQYAAAPRLKRRRWNTGSPGQARATTAEQEPAARLTPPASRPAAPAPIRGTWCRGFRSCDTGRRRRRRVTAGRPRHRDPTPPHRVRLARRRRRASG